MENFAKFISQIAYIVGYVYFDLTFHILFDTLKTYVKFHTNSRVLCEKVRRTLFVILAYALKHVISSGESEFAERPVGVLRFQRESRVSFLRLLLICDFV